MSGAPLVSIIVNNYNYQRFLGQAIESALSQSSQNTEVIVVDDGSTDDSRQVIADYGDRVVAVLKENGGQASALNAGFAASRGNIVLFLDADDTLLPTAIERVIPYFRDPHTVKVHWPLWEVDDQGRRTGRMIPAEPVSEGNLRESVIRTGPHGRNNPPTSGNAWARRFLEAVLPIPEDEYRISADAYLFTLAPLFGHVRALEPQACYRVHGANHYWGLATLDRLRQTLRLYDHRCLMLSKFLRLQGVEHDPKVWKHQDAYYAWMAKLLRTLEELDALLPPGATVILVDGDEWGGGQILRGRVNVPFTEREGKYWGPPATDEEAVREVERLRQAGASFLVVGWPAFWWLTHYSALHCHLRSHFRCVRENDRVVVFDLR